MKVRIGEYSKGLAEPASYKLPLQTFSTVRNDRIINFSAIHAINSNTL